MPGNNDDLLGRLIGRDRIERSGEDEDDYRPPPPETAWRERTDGPALALARLGVGFGILLLIVPGLLAARAYGDWLAGRVRHPRLPWFLGVTALWLAVVGPLYLTPYGGIALLAGVVALPAALLPVLRT